MKANNKTELELRPTARTWASVKERGSISSGTNWMKKPFCHEGKNPRSTTLALEGLMVSEFWRSVRSLKLTSLLDHAMRPTLLLTPVYDATDPQPFSLSNHTISEPALPPPLFCHVCPTLQREAAVELRRRQEYAAQSR